MEEENILETGSTGPLPQIGGSEVVGTLTQKTVSDGKIPDMIQDICVPTVEKPPKGARKAETGKPPKTKRIREEKADDPPRASQRSKAPRVPVDV
jgi:hypothetical protein